MSHRIPLTAVVTTVLGVTLGGLLAWRVYRTKRRRLLSNQKAAETVALPCPAEKDLTPVAFDPSPEFTEEEVKAGESKPTPAPPTVQLPSCEQVFGVNPVTVSSTEEWQQLWPLFQKELSDFPMLGLDCEWVSVKGKASAVSLLQMASYSGRCILVQLLHFRNSQQPFPEPDPSAPGPPHPQSQSGMLETLSLFLHLQRRHHATLDLPLLHGHQRLGRASESRSRLCLRGLFGAETEAGEGVRCHRDLRRQQDDLHPGGLIQGHHGNGGGRERGGDEAAPGRKERHGPYSQCELHQQWDKLLRPPLGGLFLFPLLLPAPLRDDRPGTSGDPAPTCHA
ncbi:uncharacterized protein [Eucyclogobius newberryi]|uniref:uncharacterized protein isoform X2 n=1 Tax=Eucyclogobius newberryi TaxID=166745 RepID=UPI003B58E8CC